ncbi:hypothetical protein G7Y79_00057g090570 [Physcia stellaris]|nr:hypothetical protein G7Y79_00057g090570 [Physcia stellaris]
MCIISQLIGLPFAVIGGPLNLAHEGVGLAVDSVAKKRKERKALRRPSKRQQESVPAMADATKECPHCTQYKQGDEIANADEKAKEDPPPSYTAVAAQVLLHSCIG